MHLRARKFIEPLKRTASALFFSLAIAYAQELRMNEKVQSNNPAYTAAMDSISTSSSSTFSIDTSQLESVLSKLRANGYAIVKTSYDKIVEYGTAADAFSGQSYSYASDPFDCTLYRIVKDGEIAGWIVDKKTKHPVMNEFGQPDPFNFYTDRSSLLFFAKTEKGEELKKLLGY
jgi:hypothetical protein